LDSISLFPDANFLSARYAPVENPILGSAMNLADDAINGILIVACGLMAVAVPIFAILAIKQWRIERQTRRDDALVHRVKARTWNARSGEWIADEDN
jgi:hypothetical protein